MTLFKTIAIEGREINVTRERLNSTPLTQGRWWLVTKSRPTLETSCTVACQAPLSIVFPRQECWCGQPFPSPGDPPDPQIEPGSPALQADSLPTEPPAKL